jgi:hypothetical protein
MKMTLELGNMGWRTMFEKQSMRYMKRFKTDLMSFLKNDLFLVSN